MRYLHEGECHECFDLRTIIDRDAEIARRMVESAYDPELDGPEMLKNIDLVYVVISEWDFQRARYWSDDDVDVYERHILSDFIRGAVP